MLAKDKHPTSSSLFAVAAIQTVASAFAWIIHSPLLNTIEWIFTFGFVLFAALAILARRVPLFAAVLAALLFGALLTYQAIVSVEFLMAGLIFKAPIAAFLLLALASAIKSGRRTERLEGAEQQT